MKNLMLIPVAVVGLASGAAHAAPTVSSVSVFATGAALGGTGPDSVAVGGGSVFVEYGNGAASDGSSGASRIGQYSQQTGALQFSYSVPGLADGLRYNPVTGMVWALQNNDANATISLINPTTHAVSAPLSYAAPYVYGAASARGYDDVAFLGGKVFLSYTQPAVAGDPILQTLDQGNTPSGALTTTNVLTAGQTGTLPDTDSVIAQPNGTLFQTAEGDGPNSGSQGLFSIISNPGTASQSVRNVVVTDGAGNNVFGLDDVVTPGATSGTLYLTDSANNGIYAVSLTGLDPNAPLASIAGFNLPGGINPSDVSRSSEIGIIDLATGVATPLITSATLPGSFTIGAFVPTAVPEPSTWALLATGLLSVVGLGRRGRG